VTHAPDQPANRYCQRLGITPPDLNVALANRELDLVHLMVLALLEAGRPLSLDAIVARLQQLDLPPRFAGKDLAASLRKGWHSQACLVRDPTDGSFALDLLCDFELGHVARLARADRLPPARPVDVPQPPDDVPLSEAEVDAAFRDRTLDTYSAVRRAAAILEASGGESLSLDDINERLVALAGAFARIREQSVLAWRSSLVQVDADGRLRLDTSSPDLRGMRRDVRRLGAARLRAEAEARAFEARRAAFQVTKSASDQREEEEARRARRALVHVVMADDVPRAAAVIDVAARELRVFPEERLRELPDVLATVDFLAGLDLRPSLRRLGLDPDRWWLAELRPTRRTFRPAEGGPAVAVSLRTVVRATVGSRAVFAERGASPGRTGEAPERLAARVDAEARALFALYQYGALHGGVRVRRRHDDDLLPVSWSLPGDPDLRSTLRAANRHWSLIEAVVGRPPDLVDPWRTAETMTLLEMDGPVLLVKQDDRVRVLDPKDVHAIRLPDPAAAAAIRPAHDFELDTRWCRIDARLEEIDPPVWRLLEVPASISLAVLHEVLQAAFGWTNSHLHVFEIGEERIGIPYDIDQFHEGQLTRSARLVTLGDVVDRGFRRFTYEYDLGDSWRHVIEIEDVRDTPDGDRGVSCLDGARAAPPEDCGGPRGYARLLDILFDPQHPEFEEMRAWVGRRFEPERFERREIDRALADVSYWR
jgi:hypothetical protein